MTDLLGLQQEDLQWFQMLARTIIVFITALIFVRLSGMRTFGTQSAFDVIVTITLGALLSRCITGHYPFFSCLGAAALLALVHRLFSIIAARSKRFYTLVAGRSEVLFEKNTFDLSKMKKFGIRKEEMLQALHENNFAYFEEVDAVVLETDGVLSVIKKQSI